MSIVTLLLFGLIILITHCVEGITGFGGTILSLPFGILLLGINVTKPILTIYALLVSIYIVIISYKCIAWKEFFKIITLMGIGLPVGIWLFNKLPESILKKILAVFILIISIRGLILTFSKTTKSHPINSYLSNCIIFISGCIHGAFACGGPLLIIYAAEKIPNRSSFRATLCLLWLILNTVILGQNALSNEITPEVLKISLYTLPFLVAGLLVGNWAHNKIKDEVFTKLVYIVLLASSIFMFL